MNTEQILIEISRMVGNVQYFPAEPNAMASIAMECVRFIEDRSKLVWLVDTFIHQIGSWKGTKEFRAVYCTRFRPKDGIEAWSEIAGFTAADSESMTYERHAQLTSEEKDRRALMGAKSTKALPLPADEIKANQELKAEIEKAVDDMVATKRLPREKNYRPPNLLQ